MIKETIMKLSKSPRVAGSERNKEVAGFLKKKLREFGHDARIRTFQFVGWELIKKPRFGIFNKNVKCLPVIWSGSTKGTIEGKLVKAGKMKTFEAYQWVKYAIVHDGKRLAYVLSRPDTVWAQPLNKPSNTPYFMVYPDVQKKIGKLIQKKKIPVKAFVKSRFVKNLKIFNIVTKNMRKKKIVICAHYDSMIGAPGANDNATGVSALLKLAKIFRKTRKIQFILFDAEEWNKFGSYSYVNSLPKKQLKEIELLINIDMIGAGKPYIITTRKLKPKICEIVKNVEIKTTVRPPFDYWPFYKKGVQILHFGSSPYKYCHHAKDTIDKIKFNNVEKIVGMVKNVLESFGA